jgi:hypothetical protein
LYKESPLGKHERRDQMAEKHEKMTFQFDERGELVSADLGQGPIPEPTHDLYKNPPPGEYVGSMDLGKIYVYRQPDGRLLRCHHFFCKLR